MQGIAEFANGTYYFIESQQNISETFADALGGMLSVFAQNVQLTLTPIGNNTISEVHAGLRKRVDGDFANASTIVTSADVIGEESKEIVVELAMPPTAQHGTCDALKATLSYLDVVSGQMVTKEEVLSVKRVKTCAATSYPHP